ncbi:MAG: DUF1684 domain-containing protein [Elusimicrobia bacterium]|nr:DUF1684 domain-containing protein [Elusimicrobiota bacterium]
MNLLLALALFIPCTVIGQAASQPPTSPRHEKWLKFKQEHNALAGGPAGMLSILDMIQLVPGQSAYLRPSKSPAAARWSREDQGGVKVEYDGSKAHLSGPGLEKTDILSSPGPKAALPNGLLVRASFLKEKVLKVWLHDPESPRRKAFTGLPFFPYDPEGVVTATFKKDRVPKAVPYLDSRNEKGTMYLAGTVGLKLKGQQYHIPAYSYESTWSDIDGVMIFLLDKTSGKTTYGGGRVYYAEFAKGEPPAELLFDLNAGHSFLCAHSRFYNCPLSLTTAIRAELTYGEKHPPKK